MGINTEQYQKDVLREFRRMKKLAEGAMQQVSDQDFFQTLDPDSNSIAVIVKHLAGNMNARWPNLLGRAGESPVRHRDREFVLEAEDTREALLERWQAGWERLFAAVSSLGVDDFDETVLIHEEPHSVLQVLNRELLHYSGHIGQIIFLAKHLAGEDWQTLSVPKGQSGQAPKKPYLEES